jgi:hypothetical protein
MGRGRVMEQKKDGPKKGLIGTKKGSIFTPEERRSILAGLKNEPPPSKETVEDSELPPNDFGGGAGGDSFSIGSSPLERPNID